MYVYECKNYFITPIILIPLLISIFGIYCLFNLTNPFVISIRKTLVMGLICILIGITAFLCILFNYINEYKNVFLEYKNGNYKVVEGYVTDLKVAYFLDSGSDNFKINNQKFDLGIDFGVGYKRGAAYGGAINKNGLYLKIKYISYKNSQRIMSIEKTQRQGTVQKTGDGSLY